MLWMIIIFYSLSYIFHNGQGYFLTKGENQALLKNASLNDEFPVNKSGVEMR